jgi:signal transduction histidine kinase/DNA-binding response OmpR family regulator
MSRTTHPTERRPDIPADPSAPGDRAVGGAASLLIGGGTTARRDSLRIAVGLTTLAVISVVMLNIGFYQSTRNRYVEQKWRDLVSQTESRRDEVAAALGHISRAAEFSLNDESVSALVHAAAAGRLDDAGHRRLDTALQRTASTFDFVSVQLLTPSGERLATTRAGDDALITDLRDLAGRALRQREPLFADLKPSRGTLPVIVLALPMAGTGDPAEAAVAVFEVRSENVLEPLLHDWPGYGPDAGAYLVRADGDTVVFVAAPGGGTAFAPGDRVSQTDPRARAAAMAAAGAESNVEIRAGRDEVQWAVTRFLPGLRWGIVGQADRRTQLEGMRGTLVGLLILDVAMALLSAGAFWFWRRQYLGGLARREMEVTRRHAARVQAVFDNAFDALVTFDASGRVRTVNPAAEALFGRPAVEMRDASLERFLPMGPLGPGAPVAGTVQTSEVLRPDGSGVPVEFSVGTSGARDDLLHTAIVRDVSERVEAERRIRSFAEGLEVSNRRLEEVNAQLEEASRLKSEFLANTSHELRTPLNGMIGFLQLVLDGMCDSPEEERDFLQQALQCSRHLLGLINDVLDIAKIEAGKLSLEIERIEIGTLFDEVYTLAHVQAAQRGLKLTFVPPDQRELGVRGDFGKIKQVLINLVGNSLKFTHHGSITVRALPNTELGYVMFEVIDTGVGIPADRQKLIFEKFIQADGSTTRRYGGTGLGLAISRSLVELMGGVIGVHSDGPGTGTRMYFSLPVWRDAVEDMAPTEEDASQRIQGPEGGPLVLVVEDDPTFRLFLGALLNQHGYRTVDARSADIGWMLARRLRPAVVVLDYALSSSEGAHLRTGWDLAERMTADPKTRRIPVVFVTGFEGELSGKLRATAFARHPHHLQKPIEGPALLGKIRELLGDRADRLVRVLMADDDPAVAAYVRKVLPHDRFSVVVATNGEECLHLLRTQARGFDLLLLDLMMPEVSGYDVLREMALSNVAPELPVLVLTNFPEAGNEEERRLLQEGLVLEVVPKLSVHDDPYLLPQIIDWHLRAAHPEDAGTAEGGTDEERAA